MGYLHPEILVIGETYPLSPIRQILSAIVSFVYVAMLIIAIGGKFIPAISSHQFYQLFK
jgi:hypothetical protein